MEQHPVPQQISSYQFRLVGDMTLKQFFQLAGGCLTALLIYASPLPGLFKWPGIVFFVILGIAMAFLPIEERPLEVWIVAFFRSIYSPTQFSWQRPPVATKYFMDATAAELNVAPLPANLQQKTESSPQNVHINRLEEGEKSFISKVSQLFSFPGGIPVPQQPKPVAPPVPTSASMPAVSSPSVLPVEASTKPQPQVILEPTKPAPLSTPPVASVAQTMTGTQSQGLQQAQFSPDAAPPHPPTQPNIIVGQVMDVNHKILEGAILEVRDMQGRPVRALRSNKAGHFLIVTPLASGKYELIIEKDGFKFDPLTFEAKGSIIPPLAISAKA